MLFSAEFLLVMLGTVAIFLAIALFAALTLHLWSPANRYGPEDSPYRYGTFKWCWEMGVKFTMTLVLIIVCISVVAILIDLSYTPFYNKLK